MGRPLGIRTDLASPEAPRRLAQREPSRRTATRMLADLAWQADLAWRVAHR